MTDIWQIQGILIIIIKIKFSKHRIATPPPQSQTFKYIAPGHAGCSQLNAPAAIPATYCHAIPPL